MNRTRRVAVTLAAATGLLGAAGAAAATVSGLTKSNGPKAQAPVSAAARPGHTSDQELVAQQRADGRTTLEDYITAMSQRADHLGQRVTSAESRLIAVRAERARLLAQVRARTAALARARVVAQEAAVATSQAAHSSPPATHTSTGASSGGQGGDDDGGDDGGSDD